MPCQSAIRRRFIVLMLLALVPIATGLFYVATMQCAERSEVFYSSDWSTVGTRHDVSYCGGAYHSAIRFWDSKTGAQEADWLVPKENSFGFDLSSTGDLFFRLQKFDETTIKVIVGKVADGPGSEAASFVLQGGGFKHDIHWADGGSKLIYEDEAGQLRCFDLDEGQDEIILWDRPSNEGGYYWQSDDNLIWYSKSPANIERSYRLVGNELVLIGIVEADFNNDSFHFFSNGARMIRAQVDKELKTGEVVDVRTGETITTFQSDEREVTHWDAKNETVTCFYGDGTPDADGAGRIDGAQIFDAQSGELQHDTVFSARAKAIRYNPVQKRFLVIKPNHEVESFDLNGHKTVVAPNLLRWWWPARILFITLAIAWWLTWSLTLRRDHRSVQPLIDIAILHAVVFLCSGVRLWAYVYGPDWSGYLHVWESVIFLGSGLSVVTWFLLWVVFGPQRWSVRVGGFVFGVAVVLGVIVLIWDAGSDAANYNPALALAQTMAGTLTQLTVQLGLLWLAHALNVRLAHTCDSPVVHPFDRKRRTSIRDLFIWMVAFGVLFTIVRLRTIAIPQSNNLAQLVTTGSLAGVVGILALWLGLGSRLWRVPIALAGFTFVLWYHLHIGRMEVMHVGFAWIPMILVSAAVLRWNGYSLRRGSKPKAEGSSSSATVAN